MNVFWVKTIKERIVNGITVVLANIKGSLYLKGLLLKRGGMKQAMETLQDFSENQKNYLLYQSRVNAQLEFNTWKSIMKQREAEAEKAFKELKKERRAKERALKERKQALEARSLEREEKEKALKEKEKALKEKNIYLKILKERGIDIDSLDL